jgi:hypothetical protein
MDEIDCGVEGRWGGRRTEDGRQIHGRAEKVGTGFYLHFILFRSREDVPVQTALPGTVIPLRQWSIKQQL